MEYFSVGDASDPMTEYDCSWGDDLGFKCPSRLRIHARPTREEVGSVGDICNVLNTFFFCYSGEEIC